MTPPFSKSSGFKMFSVHTKMNDRRFQISRVWKAILKKLCFRDGLVWTVGLDCFDFNLQFNVN